MAKERRRWRIVATMNKSEFENICKEDYKQYQDLAKRFQNVKMENAEELNDLLKRTKCQ